MPIERIVEDVDKSDIISELPAEIMGQILRHCVVGTLRDIHRYKSYDAVTSFWDSDADSDTDETELDPVGESPILFDLCPDASDNDYVDRASLCKISSSLDAVYTTDVGDPATLYYLACRCVSRTWNSKLSALIRKTQKLGELFVDNPVRLAMCLSRRLIVDRNYGMFEWINFYENGKLKPARPLYTSNWQYLRSEVGSQRAVEYYGIPWTNEWWPFVMENGTTRGVIWMYEIFKYNRENGVPTMLIPEKKKKRGGPNGRKIKSSGKDDKKCIVLRLPKSTSEFPFLKDWLRKLVIDEEFSCNFPRLIDWAVLFSRESVYREFFRESADVPAKIEFSECYKWPEVFQNCIPIAIAKGDLNALQYFMRWMELSNVEIVIEIVGLAAEIGNIRVLRWLLRNWPPLNRRNRHNTRRRPIDYGRNLAEKFAWHLSTDILKEFYRRGIVKYTEGSLRLAMCRKDAQKIEWLMSIMDLTSVSNKIIERARKMISTCINLCSSFLSSFPSSFPSSIPSHSILSVAIFCFIFFLRFLFLVFIRFY
jgi:hypothetical protein